MCNECYDQEHVILRSNYERCYHEGKYRKEIQYLIAKKADEKRSTGVKYIVVHACYVIHLLLFL